MLLLKRSLFFSLIVFLFTYTPATSAELKLTASDGEAYDWFGGSVSISGDYAIVGVPGDDDNGDDSGSAYIFKRSGDSWTQIAKLTASDGQADDWFGVSVSISGDYAIVGVEGDDDNGDDSGSAYVFDAIVISGDDPSSIDANEEDEESGCFIATAAYGSPMQPYVVILREFRDHILLKSGIGKTFVQFYYKYSPPLADFIAEHTNLRAIIRVSLLPIVGMSWVALNHGSMAIMALMLFFSFCLIGIVRVRKKFNR